MEAVIVLVIVGIAITLVLRKFYMNITSKTKGCNCSEGLCPYVDCNFCLPKEEVNLREEDS